MSEKYFTLLMTVLIVGGLTGVAGTAVWHWPEVLKSCGEATFIAGVLGLTVDRFVKERLLKEVTKDVFHHMVGYPVPEAVRDKIKELINTPFIAREKRLELTISKPRSDDTVRITSRRETTLENITRESRTYDLTLNILEADRPTFLGFQVIGRHIHESIDESKVATLVTKDSQSGLHRLVINPLSVEPQDIAGEYTVVWHYEVTQPRNHYHVEGFLLPTLGVRVRVIAPPGTHISVLAPLKTFKHVGDEWFCNEFFLPGEFMLIEWLSRA